jgi:hypothetical protein
MSFEIKGINELQNKLDQISNNLEKNSNKVSFEKLFTGQFMRNYTSFATFNEFLNDGGFIVKSSEDFLAIPDNELDNNINKTTKFSSWEEMSSEATSNYIVNQLKL